MRRLIMLSGEARRLAVSAAMITVVLQLLALGAVMERFGAAVA